MSKKLDEKTRSSEIWVCHLGVVPYADALEMQHRVRSLRQDGDLPDSLLLLEHPPLYTRGRRSAPSDLPRGEGYYRERGIEIFDVDRGGRLTYHAPGQLVGYPVMGVSDVVAHVRTIEQAIVDALAAEGIGAHARVKDGPDYTGVWVQDRKIASIGVHVQRGVSTHGFAVNVSNELEPFSWVLACGLPDVSMTSVTRERELAPGAPECRAGGELSCFRRRMAHAFSCAHGRRQRLVGPRALGIEGPLAAPAGPRADREPVPA
jgi:lipoyl(octanoyl) transferase